MGITYVKTSIFDSEADAIVNPVNTEGVMGGGLAKQFRDKYPWMDVEYRRLCETGKMKIGSLFVYVSKSDSKTIINFPTKEQWRNNSKLKYIESGLKEFVNIYKDLEIHSVAFPKLGCGLGWLDWLTEVKPLMEKYLSDLDIDVYIHTNSA